MAVKVKKIQNKSTTGPAGGTLVTDWLSGPSFNTSNPPLNQTQTPTTEVITGTPTTGTYGDYNNLTESGVGISGGSVQTNKKDFSGSGLRETDFQLSGGENIYGSVLDPNSVVNGNQSTIYGDALGLQVQAPNVTELGGTLNTGDKVSVTGTSTSGGGTGTGGGDNGEKVEEEVIIDTNVSEGGGNGEGGGGRTPSIEKPPKNPPREEEIEVEEETPMTYAEWVEYQKQLEAEQRAEAERQAEIYRERAEADAQAAYLQNKATYGANAETMAQMGLTGGGYSDYLNSQAYAQKRADMQTAQANEAALKQQAQTTYAEGIRALDKGWMEYNETQNASKKATYNQLLGYAMDAESGLTEDVIRAMGKSAGLTQDQIQEIIDTHNTAVENAKNKETEDEGKQQATYSDKAYKGLLADVQNPNTYGNYTEAGIRSLGKQWGWTEDQIQEAVDIWKSTKDNAEIALDEEEFDYATDFSIDDVVNDIVNDKYLDNGKPVSMQAFEKILKLAQYNGAKITDEEISGLVDLYQTYLHYNDGKMTFNDFLKEVNAYKESRNATPETPTEQEGEEQPTVTPPDEGGQVETPKEEVVEDRTAWDTVSNAKEIASKYVKPEWIRDTVVSVTAPSYKSSDFGVFFDTGKAGTLQEEYVQAIVDATKDTSDRGLKEGDFVQMNYGYVAGINDVGYFLYLGNGVFIKIPGQAANIKIMQDGSLFTKDNIYIPLGYKSDASGRIVKSNSVSAS